MSARRLWDLGSTTVTGAPLGTVTGLELPLAVPAGLAAVTVQLTWLPAWAWAIV
ncbi:MAG: hypothetical protein M3065_22710 [Actinomycetota bacterium]|nr:hypothetical protein [Actinomycetota bacterium]